MLGRLKPAQAAGHRKPVIPLLGAILGLRDWHSREGTIRALVLADEPMRVRENLVPGCCIKRTTFRVLDASIVVKRGLFRAARIPDAFFSRKRINISRVQIEIAADRTQLRGFRYSAVRVFGSDLGKFEGRLHHAVETRAGEVAGVGAGRAFAVEHAQAYRLRSGFL